MINSTGMSSRSSELFARALNRIPGGVNSPVRAFRGLGRDPFFVDRAQHASIWDADFPGDERKQRDGHETNQN